jgi:hypothetical protein
MVTRHSKASLKNCSIDVRGLALARAINPLTQMPQGVRRDEGFYGWLIHGDRQTLIAAQLAEETWFPDGKTIIDKRGRMARRKSVMVDGREIVTSTRKRTDEVCVRIEHTAQENVAFEQREREEEARRHREERKKKQDARDAAASPEEWKARLVEFSRCSVSTTIEMLSNGRVKRISSEDTQKLVNLAAELHNAMSNARVIVTGRVRPELRVVK